MEQQLSAGLVEGEIAEFVDDDEIVTQQGLDDATAFSGSLFLFKLVDEVDEIEEAAARSGADDDGGDSDGEMGLSRAASTDQDEVALGFDKVAAREFADLSFIDRR